MSDDDSYGRIRIHSTTKSHPPLKAIVVSMKQVAGVTGIKGHPSTSHATEQRLLLCIDGNVSGVLRRDGSAVAAERVTSRGDVRGSFNGQRHLPGPFRVLLPVRLLRDEPGALRGPGAGECALRSRNKRRSGNLRQGIYREWSVSQQRRVLLVLRLLRDDAGTLLESRDSPRSSGLRCGTPDEGHLR